MKSTVKFKHKKVLVLGLAKSGVTAASLLHKLDAFVTVNDQKPLSENPAAQGLLQEGIKVITGSHPIELMDEGFQYVIKNPGIPYTNPLIQKAIEKGIPVLTEVELAYLISEAEMIGITGTNGKTTTTTLLFEMLADGDQNPLIAGNIGTVASEVAQEAGPHNKMVVELSSFQLMGIEEFKPHIAIITNLYEAHLDYHGSLHDYWQAKVNITKNQTEDDFLIINDDQTHLIAAVAHTKAQVVPFSTTKEVLDGAYIKEDAIYFRDEFIVSLDDIVLPGAHNLENILSAVAACKLYDVPNESIRKVLSTFAGVKHRTQFVKEVEGRKFYNDSKATNSLATKSALNAFAGPTILLAGGLDRGNDFDDLIPYLKNVSTLIVFGETAQKLAETGRKAGIESIITVDNVEKAVPVAYEHSQPGDVILLSPACASWDQYRTFEERGDMFIQAVHML
ncbi:UDP-N-acetylmuramoyl-L-alanine--D-glutamate ligase [Rossellomorea marisflavi]|uniref:UDP-N-acetylmuramoylalanine--D-glutamate ligase n=1 Tax=Rossellomorea marisflavi TaxID=189381 RepID=A0A165KNT3_9BACI|nr:UDP-N-acetylmuramoyl-L-alanine--D-glutamate ligase [Rossellomorea marisflavi]KMK96600.1 UDP-N-acetylmuramoyl-L-alanyl-D-glutamate synthetase [Rossellomorea marisflavi]KZE49729.1 UDP-N-acetylmuramoylalanine--D-glutamate ligase [Rossellomorea marisflavi]QHA36065.1 UDP-N-acetylmuramoyl-L-alanine--D-glutamate ligase [Rossellomorea marisflavi]TYO72226.1 UDP-N-acetylmuramoyl-L-alanine--D-glutamate ligase [Rossellomorea marisflavi]USK94003.1 UDP-N-acetylmuramoyl-L-alanine--D-glutamate ligase [Ross